VKDCGGCNGRGVRITTRQLGPMVQQMQSVCMECHGEGQVIRDKDRCKTCHAKKVIQERKVLEVHIDKGMKGGQRITFSGEADQAPGMVPGDIIIILDEKEHPYFKRTGNDLFYEATVDLLTALAGGQFSIKHLDDRMLVVNTVPGEVIRPGELKSIVGEGMPSYRHHYKGNIYVQFKVEFPSSNWATPEQLEMLETILPPREPLPSPDGMEVEEVVLGTLDASQHAKAMNGSGNGGARDDDDDDEETHHHGPQMQCAQQ